MKQTYLALALMTAFAGTAVAADSERPPNPQAGECYARVFNPPQFSTSTETVTVKEATSRIDVTKPVYGTEEQTVVVQEATTKLVVVPATYKTVTEQVLVQPETTRLEVVPATYGNKSENILVKAASTEWKRGRAWLGDALATKSVANGQVDDDVMCLVEVPAVYKTVTTRVEVTPASTREVKVPAVYKTVTRTVEDQPATTREVQIPEVTKTITVTKLVTPAQERVIDIPAEYAQVTKTEQVSEGSTEWRSILCETNATPSRIMALQSALKEAGYNPGRIDGVIRNDTMSAVNAYQRANGLPVDRYINMETVKALGI